MTCWQSKPTSKKSWSLMLKFIFAIAEQKRNTSAAVKALIYTRLKKEIEKMNLPANEHEQAIKTLCEKMEY